jgi:hypothetical protein
MSAFVGVYWIFVIAILFHKQLINVRLVTVDSVVFSEHNSRAEVSQHILVFYVKTEKCVRLAQFHLCFSLQSSRLTFMKTYYFAKFIVDSKERVLCTFLSNIS